ncbi:uncharacterized protein PV09_06575 [Verruconis gallopava]|uniref:Major facilitator superfamily (MFS) profile domain-containing protein n=1 Tax=Verruconis gallopava TaxID=253628 RepID=A0A0D1YMW0_9PEZI|nr:uncharacterized protein PV09_06575 [Verruconis gallopava]KIW02082.1 hypothetical protein PV09_06575 [Verruconis gallopava]
MAEISPADAQLDVKKEGIEKVEHVNSNDASSDEAPAVKHKITTTQWLAIIALALSYMTAFQQGACTAAIVKSIDEALGPTTYYNWMLTANTITSTISLPVAGGLSDIFGRRWFMICGGCLSLLSAIIALCAKNINTMIAASAVGGLGRLAAVAELVPNNKRGIVQGCLDVLLLPWSVFGVNSTRFCSKGKANTDHTSVIIGIVLNAVSIALAYLFYFPPRVGLRIGTRTKIEALRQLDWTGVFLLNSGLILFLVAIGLGGTTFPWGHAGFIAPFVVGVVLIAIFIVWEAKFASFPFLDHDLFKGKTRTFSLYLVVDFVAGMGLYAAAAFWAQLARGIWEASPIKVGILCIPGGACGAVGGFFAGMLIGQHKLLKANLCLCYGTAVMMTGNWRRFKTHFHKSYSRTQHVGHRKYGSVIAIRYISAHDTRALTLVSPDGPHGIPYALGIASIAMLGTGWTLIALIVCVQLAVEDKDIGSGTLLLGSVRAIGGSVAITIYSALLQNNFVAQSQNIALQLLEVGAPLEIIQPLVLNLINENFQIAEALPGVTPQILSAARQALKSTWATGFHHVYYCAASFGAAAFVAG